MNHIVSRASSIPTDAKRHGKRRQAASRLLARSHLYGRSSGLSCRSLDEIRAHEGQDFDLRQLRATENSYTFVMIDIEAKLNCERHIADLTLRIAQLKQGSGAGSDVLVQPSSSTCCNRTLDGWEDRKKSLAEPLSDSH